MTRDKCRQGMYLKGIAAEPGVHPRKMRRALQRDDAPSRARPGARKSKLDPYRGEVERAIRYLKGRFFVRCRAFESLAHLNRQLQAWLAEEADRRKPGTHKEVVREASKWEAADIPGYTWNGGDVLATGRFSGAVKSGVRCLTRWTASSNSN